MAADLKLSEDMIERLVEMQIDHLDKVFLKSDMGQSEYHGRMDEIKKWADEQYAFSKSRKEA